MNGKTPYEKLKESGYNLPIEFCAFPPVILDKISPSLVLNFSKKGGNDLCVYDILKYISKYIKKISFAFILQLCTELIQFFL